MKEVLILKLKIAPKSKRIEILEADGFPIIQNFTSNMVAINKTYGVVWYSTLAAEDWNSHEHVAAFEV